jgi:hypothetical protein
MANVSRFQCDECKKVMESETYLGLSMNLSISRLGFRPVSAIEVCSAQCALAVFSRELDKANTE